MRKVSTQRKPKPSATLKRVAVEMLAHAEQLLALGDGLDTSPRDTLSEGLAFVVYIAYDTMAVAECVDTTDFVEYIQHKTYQWFRDHGFVEWFCAGASTLFKTSPRLFFRSPVVKQLSKGKGMRITRGAAV